MLSGVITVVVIITYFYIMEIIKEGLILIILI